MPSDDTIFANLISRCARSSERSSNITFLSINKTGDFKEEYRDYKSLWENGNKFASALYNEGVGEGDKVSLVMQNHPEFVDMMVASSITGCIYVPVDPRVEGDSLVHLIDFSDSIGVVCADYALDNLIAIQDRLPKLKWIWVLDSMGNNVPEDMKKTSDILGSNFVEHDVVPTDPTQPMQLLYTSGTTGAPKAIMASYARYAQSGPFGQAFGITATDKLYTGLSLTHANAQMLTLGVALYLGLDCVISRKFTKSRLWDITRIYKCTSFNLLGGMTSAIYAEPRKDNDTDNPVRQVLAAGMPVPIWEDFAKRFDVKIKEAYGAAEGGLTVNLGDGPVGSCGKVIPILQMKIVDKDDNEVAAGEVGEICFRPADGTAAQISYFKDAGATAKKTAGGWLHMGDIGHVDKDGWLYFHYRAGNGIRRNGDFINPGVIEKVIADFSVVDDVYVYGIPAGNGVPGEKDTVAAVETLDGQKINIAALYAHCKEKLTANYMPDFIQLVDEIPKTASEKPQDRFLMELLKSQPENIYAYEQ